eukprot:jgi/Chrpa1/9904/Chrysochromulina_OHIO_Genome00002774-RA
MGVLSEAKARASRLCEPSDDSMYKPMSHNVGDHYSKPRAASAPPERPHGSGTLHLHRFEGLITLPQKRHKENVVDARVHRIGGESELLDASNYDGYLPRRAKHAGMLGAPTGADSAIGATRVVDRDISPEVFEGALGQETRPKSLVAAEAGDSPSHRYSVVKAGASSITINRTDAERFPGINERFDRPLAPRRGWGGAEERTVRCPGFAGV